MKRNGFGICQNRFLLNYLSAVRCLMLCLSSRIRLSVTGLAAAVYCLDAGCPHVSDGTFVRAYEASLA